MTEEILGFSWYFENISIYGSAQDLISMLNNRKAKHYGEFLGVVYGMIPYDPYRVVYQWINDTPAFKQREALRSMRKKAHMTLLQWKEHLKGKLVIKNGKTRRVKVQKRLT